MCTVKILTLFMLFLATGASDDLTCPVNTSQTSYNKLTNDVTCKYDSSVRPVSSHKKSTPVAFNIILKSFKFDMAKSTFSIDAWVSVYWKDQHLTWKPSEHDNIQDIYLMSYLIWVPDLSIFNLANQGHDQSLVSYVRCLVTFQGTVSCIPSIHMDVLCVPNLSKFPFDKQDCKLRIGSWMYKGEEVDIVVGQSAVNTEDFTSNGEWAILSHRTIKHKGVYPCCPNSTYPSVDVIFTLRRLAGSHSVTIVIPSIACVILTLMVLSLSPVDKQRLILSCVNLVCHFMQIQYLAKQVPLKGDNMPLIVIFGRDTLIMALIALIFTLVLKSTMQRKSMPPGWVSRVVSGIISCKPGQMILLSDYTSKEAAAAKGEEDGDSIIGNTSTSTSNIQDWELFAKILDKTFFIVYIVTYFVMIISLLP